MMGAGDLPLGSVTAAPKENYIEFHPADFVSHCATTQDIEWLKRLADGKRLRHAHLTGEALIEASQKIGPLIEKARKFRKLASVGPG
jgi:hypothetical protein